MSPLALPVPALGDLTALTVRSPYAGAFFADRNPKDVENRSALTKHRGLLLIHEGTSLFTPFDEAAARIAERTGIYPEPTKRGAVIGLVVVTGAHWATAGCCSSPWADRPLVQSVRVAHWTVAEPRLLAEPVEVLGRLQTWRVAARCPDAAAAIRLQLERM